MSNKGEEKTTIELQLELLIQEVKEHTEYMTVVLADLKLELDKLKK